MTNVLLQTWNTPFRTAPFDAISDRDFAPALDVALTRHRAEIDTIATASAPALAGVYGSGLAPTPPERRPNH